MVSVSQVVDDADLGLHVVHGPRMARSVSWVATSELPEPASFFKGGELVLTTGLQTVGWQGEWTPYVESLADVGIAAIGFGTGLTYDSPPADLIEACRRHDVNLVEVPRRTPFIAISQRVATLLADEEDEDARAALRDQRALTSAAMKPDATVRVLRAVARAIGGACLIDPSGRVVEGPVGTRDTELESAQLDDAVRRLRASGDRTAGTLSGPAGILVLQPLGVRNRRPSYLVVTSPQRLSEGQRSTVTAAVALLSLIEEQQRASGDTLGRLRANAIELAVTGHGATAQLVLKVDPASPTIPDTVQVIRAQGASDDVDEVMPVLDHWPVVAALYDDELCVLVDPSQTGAVGSELARAGLRIGVGRATDLPGADESYRTAGLALAQASTSTVVDWDQLIGQGPLGLIDRDAAAAFATSLIGDLDGDQLHLLRIFLVNNGSMFTVAEELGVHRNTVRNRMTAIEAIVRGSLDDPQVRVSAWIALQSLPREGVRPGPGSAAR